MGHQNHGGIAFLAQIQKHVLNVGTSKRIESAHGFVKQQKLRIVNQGAGNGHALRHTATNLVRKVFLETGESDFIDKFLHTVLILLVHAASLKAHGNVVFDGEPREKTTLLENVTTLGVRSVDAFAIQKNLAFLNRIEACNQPQERCLSAAGTSENRNEFAAKYRQIDIVENSLLVAIRVNKGAVYIANLQDFFFI